MGSPVRCGLLAQSKLRDQSARAQFPWGGSSRPLAGLGTPHAQGGILASWGRSDGAQRAGENEGYGPATLEGGCPEAPNDLTDSVPGSFELPGPRGCHAHGCLSGPRLPRQGGACVAPRGAALAGPGLPPRGAGEAEFRLAARRVARAGPAPRSPGY